MANVTIVKLKVRRGSDAQRKTIVLDQGEVGYTLDTRRLFVGDGATEGGHSVGAKNVGPYSSKASLGPAISESPGMQVGDLGYAESKLYTLTSTIYNNSLSGWAYIGNKPDGTLLDFVGGTGSDQNYFTVKKDPGAIDSRHLDPAVFGQGLLSSYDPSGDQGKVEVNLNSTFLELSGATQVIGPKANSITEREIASTALLSGLQGGGIDPEGGYQKLSLKVNTDQFQFDSNNKLEIKALGNKSDGNSLTIPTTIWAGAAGSNLGGGLNLQGDRLQAVVQGTTEGSRINLNNGLLTLNGAESAAQEFPFLDTQQGLITKIQSSIFDIVTAQGLSGSNAGDGIPIGSIIPHAAVYTKIPAGYLLCDGTTVSRTVYDDLFDIIGTTYGSGDGSTFGLPNLTGGNVTIYGHEGIVTSSSETIFLTGAKGTAADIGVANQFGLSAAAVNFIIKALEDPLLNIFNGAPDQVTRGYLGTNINGGPDYKQQVYECLDNSGHRTLLSSAGFIRFGLSGTTRGTDEKYDKFAIPVFNW
jgi:hypothetical protein|tara:strand:- start:3325 stop:4908 length:1584 start_codon:yes stop_codon:yes gene_type:complete